MLTLAQPLWGTALAGHLAYFGFALLFAHLSLAFACWSLGKLSFHAWPSSQNSVRSWMLLWFLLLTSWILTANATWYPWSSLGAPYADIAAREWHGVTLLRAVSSSCRSPVDCDSHQSNCEMAAKRQRTGPKIGCRRSNLGRRVGIRPHSLTNRRRDLQRRLTSLM